MGVRLNEGQDSAYIFKRHILARFIQAMTWNHMMCTPDARTRTSDVFFFFLEYVERWCQQTNAYFSKEKYESSN